ncbi:MAG: hypothetical protein ABIL09_01490, partial [Gemmatimonadota bacterium]
SYPGSAMIWTMLAALAVLATKFVTALRLKDMKAKLEGIQPYIEEIKAKVAQAEDEFADLKMREESTRNKMTHLRSVVQFLETTAKSPSPQTYTDEREQVLQAAVEEQEV